MPASRSAAEFTQAPWWSRFGRNTGRSPTTASRSAARGPVRPEGRHRPAAAEHPGAVRVRRDVRPDRREVLRRRGQPAEVAAQPLDTALDRVHVGVLEAGLHDAAGEVDDLGAGRGVRAEVGLRHDGHHPAVRDGEAVPAQVGAAVEDVPVAEDQVGDVHAPILPTESVGTPADRTGVGRAKSAHGDGITCIGPRRTGTMGAPT